MKVWLDDQRDIFYLGSNESPQFDIHVLKGDHCIQLINADLVTYISFDHDLGEGLSGYDVAKHIEQRAYKGHEPPPYAIHSGNSVGRENIQKAMERAFSLYQEWVESNQEELDKAKADGVVK